MSHRSARSCNPTGGRGCSWQLGVTAVGGDGTALQGTLPAFNLWGAIPLRRGEADTTAIRKALEALAQNKIVAIAPEGTRSETGRSQRGHPGIVTVALRSGATLLPLVYYGSEFFQQNIRKLQRTDFHIQIGRPFKLDTQAVKVTHEIRQQIVDEIMFQLAVLLPQEYRGDYADIESATQQYLCFSTPLQQPESGDRFLQG